MERSLGKRKGTQLKRGTMSCVPFYLPVELIHALARDGLEKFGHHGPMAAMGVPRPTLPQWDDIQMLTAQVATKPHLEDVEAGTDLVIGPQCEETTSFRNTDFRFGHEFWSAIF